MLGYTALCGEDTLYIFPDAAQDAERLTAVMDERYRLYETTVYDRTTPDFDKTGVGKYTATDPAARLVGIAYTAGHTAAKSWGSAARPLLGAYTSDDREIIYRHGVWLAAAGVDFVYVDWSRNTLYDPDTAGDKRSEYRTIEETTDLLFEIWSSIPGAPRICILLGPGTTGRWASRGQSPEEGGSGFTGHMQKNTRICTSAMRGSRSCSAMAERLPVWEPIRTGRTTGSRSAG